MATAAATRAAIRISQAVPSSVSAIIISTCGMASPHSSTPLIALAICTMDTTESKRPVAALVASRGKNGNTMPERRSGPRKL